MHKGAFFFLIPLQKWTTDDPTAESQGAIYRIGFNVPAALGPPPLKPSLEYLQEHLDTHAPLNLSSDPTVNPNPVRITKSELWATRFRTHAAIRDKFVFRLHARDDTLGGYVALIGTFAPLENSPPHLAVRKEKFVSKTLAPSYFSQPNHKFYQKIWEYTRNI